ncbi:MAG: methyltransferase domain-containing protein [Phycisphaerae bacterium]
MKENQTHLWKHNAQSEFNRWAQTYDRSILNHLLFHRCYLKFIECILRYLPAPDRVLRLLDVGCGTGTFASMLEKSQLPISPMGLDMAEKMCQLAHLKARQMSSNQAIRFVTGDSEHIPFADCSFDIVTCSNSYHHYPHQRKVLAEFLRILKPGGRVIIIDGFRDNVIGRLIFDLGVALVEKSVHHCSAIEIRDQLRSEGYIDVVQEKFGFWVPVLASVARKSNHQDTKTPKENSL